MSKSYHNHKENCHQHVAINTVSQKEQISNWPQISLSFSQVTHWETIEYVPYCILSRVGETNHAKSEANINQKRQSIGVITRLEDVQEKYHVGVRWLNTNKGDNPDWKGKGYKLNASKRSYETLNLLEIQEDCDGTVGIRVGLYNSSHMSYALAHRIIKDYI